MRAAAPKMTTSKRTKDDDVKCKKKYWVWIGLCSTSNGWSLLFLLLRGRHFTQSSHSHSHTQQSASIVKFSRPVVGNHHF